MSYAEDEGYYVQDEIDSAHDKMDYMDHYELWLHGRHKDAKRDIIYVKDMSTDYINNVIRRDKTGLTYPLELELRIRKLEL